MTDDLTLAALMLSAVTLVSVLLLAVMIRRKPAANGQDTSSLESTINEVKGSVTGLHAAVAQLLPTMGEIKAAADQTSSGMVEMRKFAELLSGSSQKRGVAGEVMVRQYLERLPREMWDSQFPIPGSEGRVDYVLRIHNNGNQLLLPIDSKFSWPSDSEQFDLEANRKAIERSEDLVQYIVPGVTTDFAVMVLPNPVLLALTSESVGVIEDRKVVPCSPEGVIIFCTLAMRAQQAVALARNVEQLRNYLIGIDGKLGQIGDDMSKMMKSLNGASRHAKDTMSDLKDTRRELEDMSTNLGEGTGAEPVGPLIGASPPALDEEVEDDSAVDT